MNSRPSTGRRYELSGDRIIPWNIEDVHAAPDPRVSTLPQCTPDKLREHLGAATRNAKPG